jgi:hypothetical protein
MSDEFDATEPFGDDHEGHDDHHGHDGHDGHDHEAHGPDPLPGVDATDLHAAVDEIAAALHAYVDSATGVRAEFGAHEADEDPRVLAVESRLSTLNAALYDLVHERLGMHSDLTGLSWDDDTADDHGDETSSAEPDTFHLGFLVWPPEGPSDESMDSVLGMIDAGGEAITQRLTDAGFQVSEWGASRSVPVLFDDTEDDE